MPFIESGVKKVHYYDLFYGKVFGQEGEKGIDGRRGKKVELKKVSEEDTFRKFILWLVAVLSRKNVGDLMKETDRIRKDKVDKE